MSTSSHSVKQTILVIIAEGFLSRLSFGIVSFALPLYARHLGLSLSEIGVLLAVTAISEQALKPFAGHAADRFGLKISYATSIAMRSLVALLLVFAATPWHLFTIRILHGFSESFRDPSVNALIAENGSRKTLASSFAWYATAKTIAGSLGKAGAGVLLAASLYGYAGTFALAFLLSVLPLYVVVRFVPNDRPAKAAPPMGGAVELASEDLSAGGESATKAEVKQVQAILPFAVLGFLIAVTANMLNNLFPVLAVEYAKLTVAQTGLIYTLSIPVVVISGPMFGWVADNVSQKLALAVRGAANILSSLSYIAFPTFMGIASGKLVDDMGKAAFRPAWGALMTHVSSFHRRSRARTIGYLSFGEGLGEIVGPILAGLLWNTWGFIAVVSVRILLALVNEVYAVALARKFEKNNWNRARNDDSVQAGSVDQGLEEVQK